MANLLIIDDEHSICWGLTQLGEEFGHQVRTASSAERGLALMDEEPADCIVLDVRLPGMDGLEALEHFKRRSQNVPIVVITAYGDLKTAVTAVRNGAFDYIVKPFDLDKMQNALSRALSSSQPRFRQDRVAQDYELVGHSAAMQQVFKQIAIAAAADISVLLHGETGTGKELAARAIHQHSLRASAPFVAVNVASLSPHVAESELFGHVKGAYTGADRDRTGLLVKANGGTLFLDEVADIPLATQVKLLRALDHKEVVPLGGNTPIPTNFRLISATHQDLRQMVERGAFRHDLFFRLGAYTIQMPPLRDRVSDIPHLVEHILRLKSAATDDSNSGSAASVDLSNPLSTAISQEALDWLARQPWQGNVRELRNAVEHASLLARGSLIEPQHFPAPAVIDLAKREVDNREPSVAERMAHWAREQCGQQNDIHELYQRWLEAMERPFLAAVLEIHNGQCAAAARTLGIHRTTLRKKLDEYGLTSQ